jgi:hypothetical protein
MRIEKLDALAKRYLENDTTLNEKRALLLIGTGVDKVGIGTFARVFVDYLLNCTTEAEYKMALLYITEDIGVVE